jgi:uncharacterized flavoprotein (TIGR03862 family)
MAAVKPFGVVVGAGPAGLMAAEAMARAGLAVTVAEAKPSIGRKFLMAGKSGLNLTKDEDDAAFGRAYGAAQGPMAPMLAAFGPRDAMRWAEGLGQAVFTGSSGRVFPVAMKASPLLRAWAGRLAAAGVSVRTRWRWTGWEGDALRFATPEGRVTLHPAATVLALGGASWARLGSDGAWAQLLGPEGVPLAPFRPANVGIAVGWSEHMCPHFGAPLKTCTFRAGGQAVRGEAVISAAGMEGGAIYALSPWLREGAALEIDLAPDLSAATLAARLARPRGKASRANHLRKAAALPPVKRALLREAGPLPEDAAALADRIKALPVAHEGARPLDEAISVAGGVRWEGVDAGLMLRARPGVFVAGEMLDWEAPTGGYLLTGCLATGLRAGQAAAAWAAGDGPTP